MLLLGHQRHALLIQPHCMQRAELTSRYLGTAEAEPISAATIKQSSESAFNLCMLPIVKVLLAAQRVLSLAQ